MKKYSTTKKKLANGGTLTPEELKAKQTANNAAGYQMANSIMGMIPGYGAVGQLALAGTQVAKNSIKRDDYGYARNQAGVVGDEIFNPLLGDVINDASEGDWGGVAKNLVGFAKPIRVLSKATGHNNATSGFWGKLNNYSGITEENANKAAYIESTNAAKAAKDAEEQAAQLQEQQRIQKQQDMYNSAMASVNPIKGYANAGIYGNGGEIPYRKSITPLKTKRDSSFFKKGYEDGKNFPVRMEGSTTDSYSEGLRVGYVEEQERKQARKVNYYNPKLGNGGFMPMASDVTKVVGPTHENGGVDINAGGNKIAEVEGGEIIYDNRVFSDRLTIDGKTYASVADKLGRKKGKLEELSKSSNYRERNSGERGLANVEFSLNKLFLTQEMSKAKENESTTFADGGSILKIAGMVAPMADNIYNASLNSKTPEIPAPNKRVSYDMTAMPMQTRYEVGNQLADANNYYQNLTKNIYSNSSSSAVGRAEAANAFANTLNMRNNIFANKANMETSLINANNQNIQNVNNQNIRNRQEVDNMNYALADNYNMAKVGRIDNMMKNQSANVANAVDDYNMMMKGYNQEKLDNKRMALDTMKYTNGASAAGLIGTSEMESMLASDPTYYSQVEAILEASGQTKALNTFRSTYKAKYGKK